MKNIENKQIEELLQQFKNNLDLEIHVKELLGISPCFILEKNNVGQIFNDLHHHDLYEILYIKEGKVSYIIEEKKYILEEGDMVLMSPTVLHKLDKILSKTTFIGAIGLGLVALVPSFASYVTNIKTLQGIGATSLIIMVGVALDLINQVRTHLLARNYETFLKQ